MKLSVNIKSYLSLRKISSFNTKLRFMRIPEGRRKGKRHESISLSSTEACNGAQASSLLSGLLNIITVL